MCTQLFERKILDDKKISMLIHYLVMEEIGKVSLTKLFRALNMG